MIRLNMLLLDTKSCKLVHCTLSVFGVVTVGCQAVPKPQTKFEYLLNNQILRCNITMANSLTTRQAVRPIIIDYVALLRQRTEQS